MRDGDVGAHLVPSSGRPVTFNGGAIGAVIPPGTESFYSDPVPVTVRSQDDLAISLYIRGAGSPGEFSTAWNESYALPAGSGDGVDDESGAGFQRIDGSAPQPPEGVPLICNGCLVYALRDVEVLTADVDGALVFLGSSSFHGHNSTPNSYRRLPDQLSVRMDREIPAGLRKAVVNRGIAADRLENASRTRLQRDVFDTVGVAGVVVWVTNDLADRSADDIMADYVRVVAEAHARGVNVYCPTWLPAVQSVRGNLTGDRQRLNDWLLTSGVCDGVVDYDAVVRDPLVGASFAPQYFSDGIHSNDAGHTAWAQATPIADWATRPPP